MKLSLIACILLQAVAISGAAIDPLASLKRDVDNWNAAAWSNFVKSYVGDATVEKEKRDEDWNAAAWSKFIKSYVDDFTADGKE
ncbi:hypothetical protein VTN77DRAFT_3164 [Rasamsonia byssochlamydoides]|uniref:uncharacterized protein n=1 Tax=Rasamsonia byssochlamydoides TaxID=89139 RepID=UPI0037442ED4